jgi:hypothetical protein
MARTTTTAAVTKRAKGAGKSSAGSRKASTRSTRRLLPLRLHAYEPYLDCSTSTSLQRLIEDLRRQLSEITRGTYAARFDRGELIVSLTKSDRAMLRSFYSAVLKAAQQWVRIAK